MAVRFAGEHWHFRVCLCQRFDWPKSWITGTTCHTKDSSNEPAPSHTTLSAITFISSRTMCAVKNSENGIEEFPIWKIYFSIMNRLVFNINDHVNLTENVGLFWVENPTNATQHDLSMVVCVCECSCASPSPITDTFTMVKWATGQRRWIIEQIYIMMALLVRCCPIESLIFHSNQ